MQPAILFVLISYSALCKTHSSEDWSAVDGHGSESDSSDNYIPEQEVRNRPRPVPRPNARVPPVVPKLKDSVPHKRNLAQSPQKAPSRMKKFESEESEDDEDEGDDDDDEEDDDDDDDENSRNSTRRAAVTISRYMNKSLNNENSCIGIFKPVLLDMCW